MKRLELLQSKGRLLGLALSLLLLAGCAGQAPTASGTEAAETAGIASGETAQTVPETSGELPLVDLSSASSVQGALFSGERLYIAAAGAYRLTGAMTGTVVVDTDGPVELILEGVTLAGQDCLDIRQSAPVTVSAAAGTVNLLTDTAPASGEASSGEPSSEEPAQASGEEEAAEESAEAEETAGQVVSSKAPLIFAGPGRVDVSAGVNNGIRCKADLTVEGGTLAVTAVKKAVKVTGALTVEGGSVEAEAGGAALAAEASRTGPGSVVLRDGSVTLGGEGRGIDAEDLAIISGGSLTAVTGGDGIRAGTVDITGGSISLTAEGDGIQAVSLITVDGGELAIVTGGGGGDAISHPGESFGPWAQTAAAEEESASRKGLKCEGSITVLSGQIGLNTADDAVHCGAVCTVDGGRIDIVSNDDGIHADDMLVIQSGTVVLRDCFEGLEAFAVELRGGDTYIRSVNDGINANGQEMFFRSSDEEDAFTSVSGSDTTYFLMSGGTLDLAVTGNSSNQGDGIDSNGAVYFTGGTAVISTYGSFLESGIDTGWGGPVITGGAVIAGGASAMTESFSESSTQCCAIVYTNWMPDGTVVSILDEDGAVLWSAELRDGFTCLQVSHPDMLPGHVYTLTYGDGSTALDFTEATNIRPSRGGFGPGFR